MGRRTFVIRRLIARVSSLGDQGEGTSCLCSTRASFGVPFGSLLSELVRSICGRWSCEIAISIQNVRSQNDGQLEDGTYIFVSLDAEPPAIFCTRRVRSSFFKSTNCFDKSFLDLNDINRSEPSPIIYPQRSSVRTWIGARRP